MVNWIPRKSGLVCQPAATLERSAMGRKHGDPLARKPQIHALLAARLHRCDGPVRQGKAQECPTPLKEKPTG